MGGEGLQTHHGTHTAKSGPSEEPGPEEREASEVRLRYLGLGGCCGPLEEPERDEGVGLPLGCGDDRGEGGGGRGHGKLGELGPRSRQKARGGAEGSVGEG